MKKEYDFSKSIKNPYAEKLKKQITIRLDEPVIAYFKKLAKDYHISYQNLINIFLRSCMEEKRKPTIKWPKAA
jgi:uncharacterized protein (DUF4415 family)